MSLHLLHLGPTGGLWGGGAGAGTGEVCRRGSGLQHLQQRGPPVAGTGWGTWEPCEEPGLASSAWADVPVSLSRAAGLVRSLIPVLFPASAGWPPPPARAALCVHEAWAEPCGLGRRCPWRQSAVGGRPLGGTTLCPDVAVTFGGWVLAASAPSHLNRPRAASCCHWAPLSPPALSVGHMSPSGHGDAPLGRPLVRSRGPTAAGISGPVPSQSLAAQPCSCPYGDGADFCWVVSSLDLSAFAWRGMGCAFASRFSFRGLNLGSSRSAPSGCDMS